MRVFISVPITGPILRKIKDFRAENPDLKVRWLFDHNLHITLLPPVELNQNDLNFVISALTNIPLPRPFEIKFDEIELGPTSNNPRLIQATGEESVELSNLKSTIEKTLKFKPDRKFKPHITLARFRQDQIPNFTTSRVHWKMLVNNFTLMESELLPTGAEYTVLKTFNF